MKERIQARCGVGGRPVELRLHRLCLMAVLLVGIGAQSGAQTVGVDPNAAWQGFMNVSNLPQNGGGFVFGSGWGTGDLRASFGGPVLTLAPNTINDPDPFWYTPSGGPNSTGNKIMNANFYVETTGVHTGTNLTFTGEVLLNSLVGSIDPNGNGWTAVAFIKDFAPDYSSSVSVTRVLDPGVFSISLDTINDPGRHIQYGFEVTGPNVWPADPDLAGYGEIRVTAVPEPGCAGVVLGACGVLLLPRRRR